MSNVNGMRGKWGLFAHYLDCLQNNPNRPNSGGKYTSWEQCVKEVNVERLASEIASTGASWFGLTMQQQSGHFCAPNDVFEQKTGLPRGTATVNRDLPMELALALKKRGVDFMLYHTGEGPVLSKPAGDALGGIEKGKPINETYFRNWLEVLREDARRYGSLVKYWWVDGCYPGLGYTRERLLEVSETLHSQNPDAAVALNYYGCGNNYREVDGIVYADWFLDPPTAVPGDDYAAGETNILGGLPPAWSIPDPKVEQVAPEDVQWHLLAFLGKPRDPRMVYDGWGAPGCKYSPRWLRDYRAEVCRTGGALTLDCCLRRDGSIDPEQLAVLRFSAK